MQELDIEYHKKLQIEKDIKSKHLKDNIEGIEKEFNIQLLNEKPYFTAIAVDFSRKPSSTSIISQTNYFESVELFTNLRLNDKSYSFNKIIRNEDVEYFTLPHLREELSYEDELIKYMIEYTSKIIQFVRRIQKQNNFFKPSFKTKKTAEDAKKEAEVNEMNRKITLLFVEIEPHILENILEGLSDIIGDDPSDVQCMFDTLFSPRGNEAYKRVNLLTPNLDGSCDCEIEIIIFNPTPSNAQGILDDIVKNCQLEQRMVNIFMQIKQDLPASEQAKYEKETAGKLDTILPF